MTEEENDDVDDVSKPASCMKAEFMGGEIDVEEELADPNEEINKSSPLEFANMNLETATCILRRDVEIEAANKKGRHREADMHMNMFADKFESTLSSSLPALALNHRDKALGLLGTNRKQAIAHQSAICMEMKKDQDDLEALLLNLTHPTT